MNLPYRRICLLSLLVTLYCLAATAADSNTPKETVSPLRTGSFQAGNTSAVNLAVLRSMRDSVCYAQSFDGPDAAQYGQPAAGLYGKGVAITGAASGPTFKSADTLCMGCGTISFWVRYDFEIIKMLPMLTFGNNYITYFGRNGSTDPRHQHKQGWYYNELSTSQWFVGYSDDQTWGVPTDPNKWGIPLGKWMNIVLTWNIDSTTVYINGSPGGGTTLRGPFSRLNFATYSLGGKEGEVFKYPPYPEWYMRDDNYRKECGRRVFDELRVYNRELTAEEIKTYYTAVTSGQDDLVKASFALPAQLAARERVALRTAYRLSDHAVLVYADFSSFRGKSIKPHIVIAGNAVRPIFSRTYADVDPKKFFFLSIPQKTLPDGSYHVAVTVNGQPSTASFERVKEEWEGNTLGKAEKIPEPYTAMTRQGAVFKCWGRDYSFTGLALPKSIPTLQPEPSHGAAVKDVLATPVQLVAEAHGRRLVWQDGNARIVTQNDKEAHLRGTAQSKGIAATVDGVLEYDGFYKMHLVITPSGAAPLDSLRLEVPMPDDQALFFNASAEGMRTNKAYLDLQHKGDGMLWDSIHGAVRLNDDNSVSLVKGDWEKTTPIWPSVWLGNDDRGIACMLLNEKTWVRDPNKPCMDLLREDGRTVLRFHFLNAPGVLTHPIDTIVTLQATPVKSRPKGGSWKTLPDYGWGYFDQALITANSFKNTKPEGPIAEALYTSDEARHNNHWWKYGCLQSIRIGSEDPVYGQMIQRTSDEWHGGLYVPSLQDFTVWAYKQWHDKTGLSGVYFDNTFVQKSDSLGSGLGWMDEKGEIHEGYNLLGQRDLLKRLRSYFCSVERMPVLKTHMTDAQIIGTLGFADFWMDGESGGYLAPRQQGHEDGLDFVDRWKSPLGLTNLRISLGRQWGTVPEYLYYWGGGDPTYAILGQFDLTKGYLRQVDMPFEFDGKAEDCAFIPYWDDRHPAEVEPARDDMLVGVWKRPGQARLLISNLNAQEQTVSVRIDGNTLGLPANAVAVCDQSGVALDYADGLLKNLRVSGHNYRVVLLAAPGVFPPVNVTAAPALLPEETDRITALCDDFSSINNGWTFHCSDTIKIPQDFHDNYWFYQQALGQLCLAGGQGTYTIAHRPFNLDNCSVQARIRVSGTYYQIGPCLALWWGKDKYVQLVAGNSRGPTNFYTRVAGSEQPFQPATAQPLPTGTVNWAKITLKPAVIECYGSTDGKAWVLLGTIPRQGLEGPPTHLVIGNGIPGTADYFANDSSAGRSPVDWEGRSYYADLITARVHE